MQSDFEPKALKEAKKVLQKHLDAAQRYQEKNKEYQKKLFAPSLWQKMLAFFGRLK